MVRPSRSSHDGGWYHITSRGNERRAIFRDDRDRLDWCETVGRMVDQFRGVVHGYVNVAIRRYEARLKADRGQTRARLRRPAEKESS